MNATVRSLRGTFAVAAGLFVLDGLVLGQGGIALFLILGAVLIGLPRALWAWKDRPLMIHRLAKAAVYFATALLVIQTMNLNNLYAERKAGNIIAALDRYRADMGRYPDRLDDLLPRYLPAIPDAKFSLLQARFLYHARENRHTLMYVVMPPFGRRVYALETHTWTSLD